MMRRCSRRGPDLDEHRIIASIAAENPARESRGVRSAGLGPLPRDLRPRRRHLIDQRPLFGHDGAYGTDLSVNPTNGMVAIFMVRCTGGDQWAARDLFFQTATQVFGRIGR